MIDDRSMFDDSHSVLVGRARSGLCALLELLDLEGCQVIIPANICPAIVVAILAAKAIPVPCATDLENGLADDTAMAQKLIAGPARGLVMPSHLYGLVKSYPKTFAAARQKGWFILENDAQGTYFNTGTLFGDALLLSYGAGKVIEAGGGGEVLCTDPNLAAELRAKLAAYPILDEAHLARETEVMLERRALRLMGRDVAREGLKAVAQAEMQDVKTQFNPHFLPAVKAAKSTARATIQARFERLFLWQEALRNIKGLYFPTATMKAPWRMIAKTPNRRDQVVVALRAQGFDAGTNYPSVAHSFDWLFDVMPESAELWGREVINLWLDATYDQPRIAQGASIIREVLDGA